MQAGCTLPWMPPTFLLKTASHAPYLYLKVQCLPAYYCIFVPTDQKVKINMMEVGVEDMGFRVLECFTHLFTLKLQNNLGKNICVSLYASFYCLVLIVFQFWCAEAYLNKLERKKNSSSC